MASSFFVVEKHIILQYNTYNRQAGIVWTAYITDQLELVLVRARR